MSYTHLISRIIERGITKPHFRFAPSPNGKVTLGHLKGLVILDQIRILTNGALDLRFDDTNPLENYLPSNYESVIDLAKSLDIRFDKVVYCSEHLEKYIDAVKILLDKGKAYFCNCKPNTGDFTLKCTCNRESSAVEYSKLQNHPKDVVKFIPLKGEPYVILRGVYNRWYPTMALQGPIDDYLQGVNVVLRGRDLESTSSRQQQIHEELYTEPYPLTEYWGRVSIWNSASGKQWTLSKSQLKNSCGFPSLEFFNLWGVTNQMLKKFILAHGFTKNDIKMDLLKLTHCIVRNLPTSLGGPFEQGYCKINRQIGFYQKNYFLNYKSWVFHKYSITPRST